MYGCPGCGSMMTFDIASQQLKCGRCDRTQTIAEADQREARHTESSFSVDVLTCPTCGAEIRAMNTAAAAFCSYCGSSVMLERAESEMDPPDTVAPFRVTREQCFDKYRSLLRKSLCVDHRLKQNVTPESFRGIYVPQYIYSGAITGDAVLQGTESKGNSTYYYNTTVRLNHEYSNILHDASKEMPDTLSERISRVEPDSFVPFSPAYLSGYFADIPDTDESAYIPYAQAETVRNGLKEVIENLDDGCTYSTAEAEKKLIPLAHASCTGHTLIPVWFMSIRTRKGLLYAVQNGVTGEMVADTPLDIPRFVLFALFLAIPLFFFLNSFLTLRPDLVLIVAMALALGAQFVINGRLNGIREKELAERAAEGEDNFTRRLKQRKRMANRAAGNGVSDTLKGFGIIGIVLLAGVALRILSGINNTMPYKIIAFVLTAGMAILLFTGGGKNSKVKPPLGSFAAFIVMLISLAVLVINPFHSDDLPFYILSFLCMATVIWESIDLLILHNRECSNPLPQFKTHQGGEDNA